MFSALAVLFGALENVFPHLFTIAEDKNASMIHTCDECQILYI
jgi:hypothetical protein